MFGHTCPWRGLVIPIAFTTLGALCLLMQIAWIPGRMGGGILVLHGLPGVFMGMMFIAWAAGLHLRHSWWYGKSLAPQAEQIGLLAYVCSVAFGVGVVVLAVMHVMR